MLEVVSTEPDVAPEGGPTPKWLLRRVPEPKGIEVRRGSAEVGRGSIDGVEGGADRAGVDTEVGLAPRWRGRSGRKGPPEAAEVQRRCGGRSPRRCRGGRGVGGEGAVPSHPRYLVKE